MSLIIALGSNIGHREHYLYRALELLKNHFHSIKASRIYESPAVGHRQQNHFLNLVAEYQTPSIRPEQVLRILLEIEKKMGRVRTLANGPRIIDLDFLIYDEFNINQPDLILPHPRMFERSFVIRPLSELPSFNKLNKTYKFQTSFEVEAILWNNVWPS